MSVNRHFVSLGMFIIDEFEYLDDYGNKTEIQQPSQERTGGGGTYACLGARIWLFPSEVGMIIDRGHDFPAAIQAELDSFGSDMWLFRDDDQRQTTRAVNLYKGDHRGFEYLSSRLRISPKDLYDTKLARPSTLHFICSPSRAATIISEIRSTGTGDWEPVTIYEPIPDRCIPEELPALMEVLPLISILSPNAEEALTLLSMPLPPSRLSIEQACESLIELGIGPDKEGHVIIRSGAMGAYVACRGKRGKWVDAFWSGDNSDKIVDVTGAGNSFLGGLSAGLLLEDGDVYSAVLYASVSASFIIEQQGLPRISLSDAAEELWNGESPKQRLKALRARLRL